MHTFAIISLLGMLIFTAFLIGDYKMLWNTDDIVDGYYVIGLRDYYFWGLAIAPVLISHFVTMWGHYYRADAIFSKSVSRVSWPASHTAADRKRAFVNEMSVWEKRDPRFGYMYKFWLLSAIATILNLVWFFQPWVNTIGHAIEHELEEENGNVGIVWGASIGYGAGYATMGSSAMLMFLVLRRSMLHALGFTYSDLLPLHRGMGFAFLFWSVVHTIGYMVHILLEGEWAAEFNLDGETRGPQNILGFVALAACIVLALLSLPYVRRKFYVIFLVTHRVMTVLTFAGTLMHYPYFITWYYVIPSMCLFLVDRFVPKIVQAYSVTRDVACSFNPETSILTMIITSKNRLEPLKPYYPGDYIGLQLRSIGEIYHPFTIASYWPEDPYTMTLYIRTFADNKDSWTHALSTLCPKDGSAAMLPLNVEGVFGDRNHDYLCADVMVIYAAGAAFTTFMSLIKSIAAEIETKSTLSETQNTIRVYLICTFKTEAELYSYGDFLHRITHDSRFTSWLWVDIHVSRPSKAVLDSVKVIVDEKPSAQISYSDSGTDGDADTLSIEAIQLDVNGQQTTRSGNVVVTEKGKPVSVPGGERYVEQLLPTFSGASSAKASTIHAVRDLMITAALLVIPFVSFIGFRHAGLEGTWDGEHRWCATTEIYDQNMTNKCMWNYTMTPGLLHIIMAAVIGYPLIAWGRRSARRATAQSNAENADNQNKYMTSLLASQIATPDGTIKYKPMRLDAEKSIQELISMQVGVGYEKRDGKTTAVFVGGPDSFLDAVERASKKASWTVDFHRETWSP